MSSIPNTVYKHICKYCNKSYKQEYRLVYHSRVCFEKINSELFIANKKRKVSEEKVVQLQTKKRKLEHMVIKTAIKSYELVESAQKHIDDIVNDNQALTEKCNKLIEENKIIKSEKKALSADVAHWKGRTDTLILEKKELNDKNIEITFDISDIMTENIAIHKEKETIKNDLERVIAEYKQYRDSHQTCPIINKSDSIIWSSVLD